MLTLHLAEASPGTAVLVSGALIEAVGPGEELAAAYPGARERRWPGLLTPGLVHPFGPELLERTYHPDPREAADLGTEPLTGAAAAELLAADPSRPGASARRGVQRLLAHGVVALAGELRLRAALDAVRRSGLAQVAWTGGSEGASVHSPGVGAGTTTGTGTSTGSGSGTETGTRTRTGTGTGTGTGTAGAAGPGEAGPGGGGWPVLDPYGCGVPVVTGAPLVAGGPAAFAVFDAADPRELAERGGACCAATVLGGRLVHRRR
ncbi:hypothetical protein SLNWT_2684 [Streptomyces albus]|uniref:Aminodeoxyfutalosine deaminase/Imidazolonepropionase-like composite domain-containing protein n=1 Tax=Streptomyces albus (strain ATCC 21838 / DSM 41398 / FERM P-419 / JCM 4703 / NBRC 107858) TaxID=1081613 RepID=A0A0B5EUZ3_STRA4|nr:hypothetical protein SLNWT_2684 [Streptomyces albus]AOU77370.1 hypothetical protein SLNHY_2679 [Streptomyces albus]AYN33145.1 hypothetical protein DUI70_2644 [Streptomyces albus]